MHIDKIHDKIHDEMHDEMMDRVYGKIGLLEFSKAKAQDLMEVGIRVDIDPDSLPDCDGRSDFLQLRSLERTIENFENEEYGFDSLFEMTAEDFELCANEYIPVY